MGLPTFAEFVPGGWGCQPTKPTKYDIINGVKHKISLMDKINNNNKNIKYNNIKR